MLVTEVPGDRHSQQQPWHYYDGCAMMTSSNWNIFRVTGPLCGEFTGHRAQRPVTRSFDVFFDLRLNTRLSKQPWGWWFETPSWSLWHHCNAGITRCTYHYAQQKCITDKSMKVENPGGSNANGWFAASQPHIPMEMSHWRRRAGHCWCQARSGRGCHSPRLSSWMELSGPPCCRHHWCHLWWRTSRWRHQMETFSALLAL